MSRIAIVSRNQKPSWKSCQVISQNLRMAYEVQFKNSEISFFDLNDDLNRYQQYLVAQKIANFDPARIVFLEHRPHPIALLSLLRPMLKTNPEYIFHIYGDFPLDASDWLNLGQQLQGENVKLLCASDAQVNFISQFVDSDKVVFKCPFPVNGNQFKFDAGIRDKIRREMNIENKTVYLYTGRISHQKQTIELISHFVSFLKSSKSDSILLIAGEFDDLGAPYLQYESCHNTYYMRYNRHREKLSPEVAERIRYVGNLDTKSLHQVYCAADFFVSLSVHNDEDFGMSPAEALCSGLPAILSAWGGYRSFYFQECKKGCSLIPVEIEDEKIRFSENIFIKQLLRSSFERHTNTDRDNISKFYLSNFSINSVAKLLESIHGTRVNSFNGFNEALQNLVRKQTIGDPPFRDNRAVYNNYYKETYHAYVK